jgi:DNA-binding beta-propeller fold protein YncE
VPLSGVAGGAGLPAFGARSTFPPQIDDLGVGSRQVVIQSFAGEMDSYRLPDGTDRLFIPTRAEGDLLEIVDARDGSLNCLRGGTNCIDPTLSLTSYPSMAASGKPRAPEPVGVGVSNDGQVYVTHLKPADSPPKSNQAQETFTVKIDAANPVIDGSRFVSLGYVIFSLGPSTSSVAVGNRYAYLSSRYLSPSGAMVWLVDRQTDFLYQVALQASYLTLEARGVALNPQETRLYVAGRNPDSLVVVNLANVRTDSPTLRVIRAVPLPEGPNEVRVISRGGLGDLVVVTSSTAGAVSIYDDGVGRLVAQIPNVGIQPFGIAVRVEDTRARIFVSNFGDGRIAVIDLELALPQNARLVAYLGRQQTCLVQDQDASCVGARP